MDRRRIRVLFVVCIFMVAFTWGAPGRVASSAPPSLTTLQPGSFREIAQDLTINIVFVGYKPGAGARNINEALLRAYLPHTSQTIARNPSFYTRYYFGKNVNLGLRFTYDYNVVYAPGAFEDAFFGYLSSIATPQPLTLYQQTYNTQAARSLDVTGNAWIDGPSVEVWLAANAGPRLGVDTRQYTIFLVNWYDRPDFRFHVYTKTDEPDPDTSYNFGAGRDSRKMIAWGGTPVADPAALERVWFYDLSAGPDWRSGNFDLDHADVDGDGYPDYRIPPVWEYGNLKGYRPFNNLSYDLSGIVRFVAIDLLFTPSPLYNPAISPPALPSRIELDTNLYQLDPAADGQQWLQPAVVTANIGQLQPYNVFSLQQKITPSGADFTRIYQCWLKYEINLVPNSSCYGVVAGGYSFFDLSFYYTQHLLQFLDGGADHEVPIFLYNTTDALSPHSLIGYSAPDLRNGDQHEIEAWGAPQTRAAGLGFTEVLIHESGHYLGLSHPHDGYDSELNLDYGPQGQGFFAWTGDEAYSVMSYLAVTQKFGQFNLDSMNRWMTAVYINQANVMLGKILASPNAAQVSVLLTSADGATADALTAYAAMDYPGAVVRAKAAYQAVLQAAAQINVAVEPESWQADYRSLGKSDAFVDETRMIFAP